MHTFSGNNESSHLLYMIYLEDTKILDNTEL